MDRLPTMHTPCVRPPSHPTPPPLRQTNEDMGKAATHLARRGHREHINNAFKCQICSDRSFRTERGLRSHMVIHRPRRRPSGFATHMVPPPSASHPPPPVPPPAFFPHGTCNNFDHAAPPGTTSLRCLTKHSSPALCCSASSPAPDLYRPPASQSAPSPSSSNPSHLLSPHGGVAISRIQVTEIDEQQLRRPHDLRFDVVKGGGGAPVLGNLDEGGNYTLQLGSSFEISLEAFREFMSRSGSSKGSVRAKVTESEQQYSMEEESVDLDLQL